MSDYWQLREKDKLFNQEANIADNKLAIEYQKTFEKTKKDLEALYNEILLASADGSLLVSDLYRFNRYYDLLNNLNKQMSKLGIAEEKIYTDALTQMYNHNSLLLDKELGFNLPINENAMKEAINAVWCADGQHWSQRVWKNKQMLQERVERGMINCLVRGDSKDDLIRQLMEDFNVGFNCASRIARTELNFVQNQCCLNKYKEAGLKQYRVLSNQAEDDCFDKNGEAFYLDEAQVGVNYPPFHPNCKCAVLGVLD